MKSNLNDDDGAIADINITPFVDIILVVLIIFMLATPVIMNPGIKVNLPQAASGESTTPSQLTISIKQDGGVYLNGEVLDRENIRASIQALMAENPDTQAILAADKDVPHGLVIQVLDEVKSAGVKKFAISTQKK